MKDSATRTICPVDTVRATISVPPSKSYTNRALIAAALADGTSTLTNYSRSDDSELLINALTRFGVQFHCNGDSIEIEGTAGKLTLPSNELFLGNAGTSLRFLAAFSSLVHGDVTLTGDEHMQKRPIGDLLEALRPAGVRSTSNNGFPPVTIHGGKFNGGLIEVDASISSQFVSSLLLSAPYAKHPTVIKVKGKPASLPYIDMTLHVMRTFGADVRVLAPGTYQVGNADHYLGQPYHIEGDASSATYFLAAAAITQGTVTINNVAADSLQGDIRFSTILKEMGCTVVRHADHIELHGARLQGIEIDMNEIPDSVPTLAVVALFAKGPTSITNIHHLHFKETNRMNALANELTKLGASVELSDDGIIITPHPLHGAIIETYNDHRMAMSFAVAGLRIPHCSIVNPGCVTKSFPNFWEEFQKLEGKE